MPERVSILGLFPLGYIQADAEKADLYSCEKVEERYVRQRPENETEPLPGDNDNLKGRPGAEYGEEDFGEQAPMFLEGGPGKLDSVANRDWLVCQFSRT